jgi:hypothetical protein|tara:strand:+ start:2628 stop:2777 length:150 start_codon:yes stop_codon:yes gene_type:complete
MTSQVLFAFGITVSILGWTLISVSDLKADMKLVKYQLTEIQESLNGKNN